MSKISLVGFSEVFDQSVWQNITIVDRKIKSNTGSALMVRNYIKKTVLLIVGVCSLAFSSSDNFRINQLGYYPGANKVVPVLGTNDSVYVLVNSNGDTVFSGALSGSIKWTRINDSTKLADFSSFKAIGTYWMKISDVGLSMPIHIKNNVLYEASLASLKSFYYQRASMAIDEAHGGRFARPAGHPDTLCYFHSSSGYDSGTISSPGGWYDAGDYGKYVVNAGVTLGTMFFFYENFGGYFGDSILNIPESNNGKDDLLDEIKYELDWLLTLQDKDGGVFHKLTTLQHASMVMPDRDVGKRYIIGKSTSAALNFAAVMAMAHRVYKKVTGFEGFADTCLVRAKSAWAWAVANPTQFFLENPSDVGTGMYEDNSVAGDEFLWAASEMFIATGEQVYKDSVIVDNLSNNFPAGWQNPNPLASLSLATVSNALDSQSIAKIRSDIKTVADTYIKQIATHSFRIPSSNYFYWGSNGVFSNIGLFLLAAFKVTNDTAYARGAAEIADYLLGKNVPNISFVSGFGIHRAEHPHHRPSMADTIEDPIPGFLMGGPNGSPASYTDDAGAYDKNEIAINWNGPMTGLFAAVNQIFGVNEVLSEKKEYYVVSGALGIGTISVEPVKMYYAAGDTIKFRAYSKENQMFYGWFGMGKILSTDTVFTLIVTRDVKITPLFGEAGELIVNGNFEKTIGSEWTKPSGAKRVVKEGVCLLTITNPGEETWAVQFSQNGIPLYTGKQYVLQFDAWSNGNRYISADVAKNGPDYGSYMESQKTCSLTPDMKHFKYIFTMKKTSDLNARLNFNCGSDSLPVYIDNVSLKLYDSTKSPVVVPLQKTHTGNHLILKHEGERVCYTITIVDPSRARFELYDLNGKVMGSFTNQIRSYAAGKNSIVLDNHLASGVYLIRFYDGEKLFLTSWSNVKR
jgi:endoglucanase